MTAQYKNSTTAYPTLRTAAPTKPKPELKEVKTPSTNDLIHLAEAADVTTRCTLAHELAHMWLGHPAPASGRQELQADRFAARLLVSPVEYELAERIFDARAQLIAAELGVTVELLGVWRGLYEKGRV